MSGLLSIPRLSLFFREAWKNVRSAPVLSLVAVLTIAVSLILVGLFGFVMINADRVLDGMARDLRVTVYLTDDITSSELDALQRRIAARDEVASITFLSAKDDRALNQALLTPALLDGLDEEAIPGQPALEVQIAPRQRTKEDFDSLMSWLRELKEVDTVQDTYFDADKIRILFAVMDLVRVTGTVICLVVLAAAIFFTFSTIKLAVYARREEIEVLRLVGATDGFIRIPFYIEGFLAGLLGAIGALIIIAFIHARLLAFVEEEHFLNVSLDLMPLGMLLWIFLGGLLLGLLGSALSVGRHLRQ